MNKYHNHAAKRRSFEGKIFNCLFLLLTLIGGLSFLGVFGENQEGIGLAMLPMFGIRSILRSTEPGGGGGGSATAEEQFRATVLDSVGQVKRQYQAVEENFKNLDKEAKKLSDDLADHCKKWESMPSQIVAMERTLAQIQLKVAQERRSNFGSAIEQISGDEQMRNAVNGMIRSAYNLSGRGGEIRMSDDQKKGAEDYRKALGSGATPGSSYINAQLIPTIYALIAEFGIWNTFDVIPVSTSSVKLIVDTTDPTMLFTAENTAPSEASYAGSQLTATINKALGWIGIANELLADSEVDLTRYLLPKFANATAQRLDHAAVNANNGTATLDGGFTGIFNGGTAAVAATTRTSIAALTIDDFIGAMVAVNAAALSRPCKWWVHPTNLVRILGVKDGNGRPIFLPSTDAPSFGAIGSILGYPVVLTHAAPSANVASSKIAVFGDPMGNAVCLRSDFEFAASDQVMFKEDTTVFRARARMASRVKQATAFGVLTNAAS